MGGVDAIVSKAQRVTIHTKKGAVLGVIGNPPPHMQKVDGEPKIPKIHDAVRMFAQMHFLLPDVENYILHLLVTPQHSFFET